MAEYGQQEDWNIYFVMVIGQALAWLWLYSRKGPLREPIHRWVAADEKREENILANGQEVGAWSMWLIVALHHGLGGILAGIGMAFQNVWLFRFGLSMEIGEDFMHYAKMIVDLAGYPTEEFSELWPARSMMFGLACHHAVGSVGGTFVFVFIPDNQLAQYCVVLLLISAVPQLFQFPFMAFENLKGTEVSCVGKVAAFLTIVGSLFAFVARMFLFPPAAFDLAGQVRGEHGAVVANSLLAASGLFMIFAIASLAFSAQEVWGAIKNLFAVARAEGPRAALKAAGEQVPALIAATEGSFMLQGRSVKSAREVELIIAERRSSRAATAAAIPEDRQA